MSRGYAILDGIPSQKEAMPGLSRPAVQASHRGEIWIYPGLASHGGPVERLYLESEAQGISLAEDAEKDSLLAYDFDGGRSFARNRRIEWLVHWSQVEADRVRHLGEMVAVQLFVLHEYRAQRGYGYDDSVFASADQMRKILRWHTAWRRWEDPALHKYRDELMELFLALTDARDAAWDSRPPARSLGQGVIDAVMVVPHVAESVGAGIVETGRMVRDLGTYSADVFGESIGFFEIDWEPWSAVGQAYASGQSTGEIAWSMVEGLSNTVDRALHAAKHGDYRALMNLSGVLTAELLLMRGFVGAARVSRKKTPANAVSIGARVAGRYQKTLDQLRSLRRRLARARNIPGRVRDELDALGVALERAIRPQMITAAARSPHALVDGLADLRYIYAAARLDKAKDRTLAILRSRGTLGGAGRARVLSTVERLERLATTSSASEAVTRVLTYIDSLDRPAAFLRALDEALAVSPRFPAQDFAGLLRRAVHTPTPAGYLSDIRWLAELDWWLCIYDFASFLSVHYPDISRHAARTLKRGRRT